jgi:hypothetical protein
MENKGMQEVDGVQQLCQVADNFGYLRACGGNNLAMEQVHCYVVYWGAIAVSNV